MINDSGREATMVSSTRSLSNINVGDRVECLGHIGTVKYIGPVETHTSEWIGIDWDDKDRGKHNGIVNGVQYFQARYPKSGSLVRPEKVKCGHSLINSIVDRYGHKEDELTAQLNREKLIKFQQSINAPFLEMVGFEKVSDKQSHYDSLRVVNLRLQNINSAGDPEELKNLCPNIQELDLSKNLLPSWKIVFDICIQLEQLCWLNLSENVMTIPSDVSEYSFPSVETLICTSMYLKWENILQIVVAFGNLKELRTPLNNIVELSTPTNILLSLTVLDIEDNDIRLWSEVCKLSVLTNLEELFVGNVGLRNIEFEGCDSKVSIFRNLKKLSISNNLIDNWESINELHRMQNLEDLRCVKNPILETQNEATRFQIMVAKIGNLKILNGTEIKADNRRGAEYDYIKLYGLEWLHLENTIQTDAFLKRHYRYLELLEKHGAPEESELTIQTKGIKNSLVALNIFYEGKCINKKLPKTILVQKLMMLVQKMFSLSIRPNLLYVSQTKSNIKFNLEDVHKELGYYSVQDGDQIIATL